MCNSVFTTTESANYDALWAVKTPSKPLLPFNRDKLLLSIYKSSEHRPHALKEAAGLTDTVIDKLRSHAKHSQIDSKQIIQTVLVALNRFDKAASVHYQAFHK
jgi:transcriptional regulator NrdR family protein